MHNIQIDLVDFINQVKNACQNIITTAKGDFMVNDKFTFEGGNKDFSQIKGIEHAYLAIDDLEIGFGNKIPLWLFGFLY